MDAAEKRGAADFCGVILQNIVILSAAKDLFGGIVIYYVYILTNWNNKVMYVGVTNNLERRVYEHKNKLIHGFTCRYNVTKLVYFDSTTDVRSAILREKQIKGWVRKRKNELVDSANPKWEDLSKNWGEKDSSLCSE